MVWYLGLVGHLFALWYALDNAREFAWFWWISLAFWCVCGLGLLARGVLRASGGGARRLASIPTPPRVSAGVRETQTEAK